MASLRRQVRESIDVLQAGIDAKHASDLVMTIKEQGPYDGCSKDLLQDVALRVLRGLQRHDGSSVNWSDCSLRHGQHWPRQLKAARIAIEAILDCAIYPSGRGAKPLIALPSLALEVHTERRPSYPPGVCGSGRSSSDRRRGEPSRRQAGKEASSSSRRRSGEFR